MATVTSAPPEVREQRVVIDHVSWETYEGLLADMMDARSPRLTYDRGTLEIMTISFEHEELSVILAMIAELVAEEKGTEFRPAGSTTFRRKDVKRGLEPDKCFYLQNADRIPGKKELDLRVDPPPDLVIEVEITSPAVSKLSIYAVFGVPEVWLTDGQSVRILRLSAGEYKPSHQSGVLPPLTDSDLSGFLEQYKTQTMLAWRKMVRNWALEPSKQGQH